MPKVVAATEAKNKLGEMLAWVEENQDEVIIESRKEPKAVLLPYTAYEEFTKLKEQVRRQDALARLEKLRERVQARNPDLTDEQAEAIADRFNREVISEMIEEGKVKYDRG